MSTVRRSAQGPSIAIAQISPVLGDSEANMVKHREAIWNAVADGVDLLVFPELSLSGYNLKDSVPDVAISRGGPELQELAALSKTLSMVVGFVEESSDHHFFNAAAYLEGGKIVAVHRKIYLPTYGMFDEQRYFARGRMIRSFKTRFGQMAMLICEDMLHPTAPVVAALDGATTLIVPSASPSLGVTDETENELDANAHHWESYNRSMARTLGVFVVHANRTGVEDGVTFWGGSEIVGPSGETLSKAPYYDLGQATAILADDTLRRRRIKNPTLADEDADLVVNELCRIRERRVPPRENAGEDRRRFDDSRPPRRDFDSRGRDDRSGGFRGGDRGRGSFGGDREGGERGRGGYGGGREDRGGGYSGNRERGGGFGSGRDDRSRGSFGGGRDDRDRGGFGGGRDDRGGRGSFGGGRDDRGGGRGGYGGGRDDRGGGRGGYGGGRDDRGGGRGGYGGGRDDRGGDRGGYGGGRDDRGGGRGSFGRDRDDRGGGRGGYGGARDDRGGGRGGYGGARDDRGGGRGGYGGARDDRGGGRGGYGGARDDRGGGRGGYGGARDDRGGGGGGYGAARDDRRDDFDDDRGRRGGRDKGYFGETNTGPGRERPAGGDERRPRKLSSSDVVSPSKSDKED